MHADRWSDYGINVFEGLMAKFSHLTDRGPIEASRKSGVLRLSGKNV